MFVAWMPHYGFEPGTGGMLRLERKPSRLRQTNIPEGFPIGSNEGPAHISPPRDDVPLECKSFMGRPGGGRGKGRRLGFMSY
jgi:hypothetical protein